MQRSTGYCEALRHKRSVGKFVLGALVLLLLAGCTSFGQEIRTEIDGWSESGINQITNSPYDEYGYDYFGFDVRLINFLTKKALDSKGNKRSFYQSSYSLYSPYRIKYTRITYASVGREIITGPRGGQYYINKNGNKTYVKKR